MSSPPASSAPAVTVAPPQDAASYPGAAVLAGDAKQPETAPLKPSIKDAPDDFAAYEAKGCQVDQPISTVTVCTYGVTSGYGKTVAVVGDSVAGQWMPALERIAAVRKWRIVLMLHSRCPFSATMTVNTGFTVPYKSCYDWGKSALAKVLALKPDALITSDRPSIGTVHHAAHTAAALAEIGAGMASYWRTLHAAGIAIVAMQESPELGVDEPDCLAQYNGDPGPCTGARRDAEITDAPTVEAHRDMPDSTLIDLNSLICGPKSCSPIVGNVLVYRDSHHLTATYAATLAPYLDEKLQGVPALR